MAFFKFRKRGDEQPVAPAQPMSLEVMRKRAKYRLIGAAVLVLIGVIGFPIMFDKQPRPISVDLAIEIPDRNKVIPLNIPAPVATRAEKPEGAIVGPAATATTVPTPGEKVVLPPVAVAPHSSEAIAKPETTVAEKPGVRAAPAIKAVAGVDEGAKAQALLDGKAESKAAVPMEGRFVVQVGAFSDDVRAREVRLKVERAGMKTYTQVAETKDGRRIRVRVGPFSGKAEADAVAEKIRKLDLPAAILTL